MQNKIFKFGILFGALLIAGLFFFRSRSTETSETVAHLKPSQMDFSKGNQLPTSVPSTTMAPQPKLELKKTIELSAEDQRKWQTFEEILNSKNDNDPRVDSELRYLSPQMHQSLRTAYSALPVENRNGRGFIAFLIGRDLKDVQDAQFLKEIFQESPCLSFKDCTQQAPADPHFAGITDTSLNYPQLATLYQLRAQLEQNPQLLNSPEMKSVIKDLLRDARQFPNANVQSRAQELQNKYGL